MNPFVIHIQGATKYRYKIYVHGYHLMTTQTIGTEILDYGDDYGNDTIKPKNPKSFQKWIIDFITDMSNSSLRSLLEGKQWDIVWLIQSAYFNDELITKEKIEDALTLKALRQ